MTNHQAALKTANIPPFGLRMQPELKRRMEAAARANNRSLNSEIVARLEQSLRAKGWPTSSANASPLSDHEQRLRVLEEIVDQMMTDAIAMSTRLTAVEALVNGQSSL